MNEVAVAGGRARKTQQEIIRLLDIFSKSNISISAFCEANNITTSSFHYWKKKFITMPIATR